MKVTFNFYLIIVVIFFGCSHSQKKYIKCDSISIPKKISDLNLEYLYKEAQWQLYKVNLLNTDQFIVQDDTFKDSLSNEKKLSEFNLRLFELKQEKDTTEFTFFFDKGVSPAENIYYYNAIFWNEEDKVELGGRISFIFDRDRKSHDFEDYILLNKDTLAPTLKCLAIERGVLHQE